MKAAFLLALSLFTTSCSVGVTKKIYPARKGNLLIAEIFQDNSLDNSSLGNKLSPISFYSYRDEVKPNETAIYNFYGNVCIKGLTYSSLHESKLELRDSDDNLKLKPFSFFHFYIHNELLNDKDEKACKDNDTEDFALHTLEIPIKKSQSFIQIFATPELEIRRVK